MKRRMNCGSSIYDKYSTGVFNGHPDYPARRSGVCGLRLSAECPGCEYKNQKSAGTQPYNRLIYIIYEKHPHSAAAVPVLFRDSGAAPAAGICCDKYKCG